MAYRAINQHLLHLRSRRLVRDGPRRSTPARCATSTTSVSSIARSARRFAFDSGPGGLCPHARNSVDWYRLFDLCEITDTVLGDDDGLYHQAISMTVWCWA
jgi:hypothetical protein